MSSQIQGEEKKLIVIGGPTAVGKTDFAIEIARRLQTEIISADSRQVYKELSIGTAKPEKNLLDEIRHHFIDEISIEQLFTAADYEKQALERLTLLFESHDVVVCAGGTGLYFKALLEGFDDIPNVDHQVTMVLQKELETRGLDVLAHELRNHDPEYSAKADLANPHRVIRALSVIRQTGKPFSFYLTGEKKKRSFSTMKFYLSENRVILYDRINQRVDKMLRMGLEDEVRGLMPYRSHMALKTVGYRELFEYFDGNITYDKAVDLIKQNSRRYAKRQMTWFRNQGSWKIVEPDDKDQILNSLLS